MEHKSTLLYFKKGNIKNGQLSLVVPCEYRFYEDKIIVRPYGWNRLFDDSDKILFKDDILDIKDGIRILGYAIIIQTKSDSYTCGFVGDKLKIKQLLEMYV